ncbi:MAG TPA: PQ-loop domain-containing transporter [Candidatus Saccharimonadales bacterium]|nr:PQ-loop domain-containing transporter [Candidatus Saccharimonadales bacterium]
MVRHAHAQKHLHQKETKHRDGLDWILYLFMVATPLFELPQLLVIYQTRSAENVSLATWAFFALSNVAWITYAIRSKLRILIVTYSLYFAIEVAIVVGILLYS